MEIVLLHKCPGRTPLLGLWLLGNGGFIDRVFVWISDAEWKIKHLHAVLIVTLPPGDNEQLLQLSFSSVQM